MTQPESLEILQSIEAKLSALLAIEIHRTLIDDEGLAKPRPRSIDRLLSDAGLDQTEIAALLGKSASAVSQMLAKE